MSVQRCVLGTHEMKCGADCVYTTHTFGVPRSTAALRELGRSQGMVCCCCQNRGVMSILVFAEGEGSAFQCQEESWQVILSPLKQPFLHNI